jgi:hypothetical protein
VDSLECMFEDQSYAGLDANSAEVDPCTLEANSASLLSASMLLLMAARFNVSAEGLAKMAPCVEGLPKLSTPSAETRRLIDADIHRRASVQRRAAAPKSCASRADKPGHTLCFDGWGPMATPSIIGKHTYQFIHVDGQSSHVDVQDTTTHREDDWFSYISKSVRAWRAWGREVFFGRFDRAGELTAPGFVQRVERELHITVQHAPAKWHEGVGNAEVNNDILTRMAECMCARAKLNARYMLCARRHAAFLLNLRPRRGNSISRRHEATGVKPSWKSMTTYVFGCTVIVLRDKEDRGPHGSLDKGRTFLARYLGRDALRIN